MIAAQILPLLPWERSTHEARRLAISVGGCLLTAMLLMILLSQLRVPEIMRSRSLPPSEELVRLSLPPLPEPEPQPEPEAEPQAVQTTPPATDTSLPPAPAADQKSPDTSRSAQPASDPRLDARAEARRHAAVFDDLAKLRRPAAAAPSAVAGSVQAPDAAPAHAGGSAAVTSRALIGDASRAASGGLQVGRVSENAGGGGALQAGRGETRVTSDVMNLGANASANRAAGEQSAKAGMAGQGGVAARSNDNIQQHFDAAKSAIFALYHRALRSNPGLQGKVVFRLEIQPDGSVSACEIVASDLGDSELERKLLARVRMINFGAANVRVWRDTYRMDFFPS